MDCAAHSCIIISPLDELQGLIAKYRQAHVIGLLGPDMAHPVLPLEEQRRLKLSFHDVTEAQAGLQAPATEHVKALVSFVRRWQASGQGPLIVHCWMGVSRSPAAAFIARCLIAPDSDEREIAHDLRHLAPFATPNARLVALADALLGREGRMVAAIKGIGRGCDVAHGHVVFWKGQGKVSQPSR